MRSKSVYIYIFVLFFLLCGNVYSSWFIDQERLHISVHGTTSCSECHQNIESSVHPNPDDVNKNLSDFFSADLCSDCHESFEEYVKAGQHGGRTVTEPGDIENCMDCHDPHYESGSVTKGTKFIYSVPIGRQCDTCHEKQDHLPVLDADDEACMSCHRRVSIDQTNSLRKTAEFCYYCHDREKNKNLARSVPLINPGIYGKGPHQSVSCLVCHPDSAQFGHSKQASTACLKCHSHHDEGTIHDAHVNVSCQVCHLNGVTPVRNQKTNLIGWQKNAIKDDSEDIHQVRVDKDSSCSRCHYPGNDLGAASMVLPAKSLICMPCHASTFAFDDGVSAVTLCVFLAGLAMLLFAFLSGRIESTAHASKAQKLVALAGKTFSVLFSRQIMVIGKSLIIDSLLQRRLMVQSMSRWTVHGLIFYPFVIRFSWGFVTLILSLWFPDWSITRIMIDKNHPVTALLFDITGIMVLSGAGMALIFRKERLSTKFKDMPKQDWFALLLLGGIITIGFILEGMRIAMVGNPEGSVWAFLGYAISRLFEGMSQLTGTYGYVWYGHAVLTGLFVAYLPFSRMLHMILSPIVMALDRIDKERK